MLEFAVYNCRIHRVIKYAKYRSVEAMVQDNPHEFRHACTLWYVTEFRRPRKRLYIKRGCGAEMLVYHMSLGTLLATARTPHAVLRRQLE